MTKTIVAALLLSAPLAATPSKKPVKAMKQAAVTVKEDEVKWAPAPAALPPGGQLAVLFGDPGKKGPYTIRLKGPDGYKVPPHWHNSEEQLTVLQGTLVMYMGDTMDEKNAHELKAGGYQVSPGRTHHAAAMKGETIVQVQAMGPFDIHYLNPADDPTKAAAAAK